MIADREGLPVGLLSIGQQDAGARDVNPEYWSCSHELRVAAGSPWITVGQLHCHEPALYCSDAALDHERLGGGRFLVRLVLGGCPDPVTPHAAEGRHEDHCSQEQASFPDEAANSCAGFHNSSLFFGSRLLRKLYSFI